jgi:hypothetical protein
MSSVSSDVLRWAALTARGVVAAATVVASAARRLAPYCHDLPDADANPFVPPWDEPPAVPPHCAEDLGHFTRAVGDLDEMLAAAAYVEAVEQFLRAEAAPASPPASGGLIRATWHRLALDLGCELGQAVQAAGRRWACAAAAAFDPRDFERILAGVDAEAARAVAALARTQPPADPATGAPAVKPIPQRSAAVRKPVGAPPAPPLPPPEPYPVKLAAIAPEVLEQLPPISRAAGKARERKARRRDRAERDAWATDLYEAGRLIGDIYNELLRLAPERGWETVEQSSSLLDAIRREQERRERQRRNSP